MQHWWKFFFKAHASTGNDIRSGLVNAYAHSLHVFHFADLRGVSWIYFVNSHTLFIRTVFNGCAEFFIGKHTHLSIGLFVSIWIGNLGLSRVQFFKNDWLVELYS